MSAPAPAARRVNVRTPEVMERVQAEVETHYRSHIVEQIRAKDMCSSQVGPGDFTPVLHSRLRTLYAQ